MYVHIDIIIQHHPHNVIMVLLKAMSDDDDVMQTMAITVCKSHSHTWLHQVAAHPLYLSNCLSFEHIISATTFSCLWGYETMQSVLVSLVSSYSMSSPLSRTHVWCCSSSTPTYHPPTHIISSHSHHPHPSLYSSSFSLIAHGYYHISSTNKMASYDTSIGSNMCSSK